MEHKKKAMLNELQSEGAKALPQGMAPTRPGDVPR